MNARTFLETLFDRLSGEPYSIPPGAEAKKAPPDPLKDARILKMLGIRPAAVPYILGREGDAHAPRMLPPRRKALTERFLAESPLASLRGGDAPAPAETWQARQFSAPRREDRLPERTLWKALGCVCWLRAYWMHRNTSLLPPDAPLLVELQLPVRRLPGRFLNGLAVEVRVNPNSHFSADDRDRLMEAVRDALRPALYGDEHDDVLDSSVDHTRVLVPIVEHLGHLATALLQASDRLRRHGATTDPLLTTESAGEWARCRTLWQTVRPIPPWLNGRGKPMTTGHPQAIMPPSRD